MKIIDSTSKKVFNCTMMIHTGSHIKAYNQDHELIAEVPMGKAKLVFNEKEIPYIG